jgi:membrane protein required for colicin V production
MNALDMVVIVILAFCLIRGIFRGLIKEMSSIIGVFAGFYAAYTYYGAIAKPLSRWISNTPYLNILSFLIIFVLVVIAVSIAGVVVKYLMKIAFLGWVDRICGAGFGITKGLLISAVILIALTAFLQKGAPVIKNSLIAPHVTKVSEKMVKIVSKDMKHQFETKLRELKKVWENHSSIIKRLPVNPK